jgi:hypothetical protein
MIRHDGDVLHIKLLDKASGDWLWRNVVVVHRGKRHGAKGAVPLSPSLIVRGVRLSLAQPYEFSAPKSANVAGRTGGGKGAVPTDADRVCSVDRGINKQAVCSIVRSGGTVLARKFISQAMHIDRRDKVLRQIRTKASQTMGNGGKLTAGFCRTLYARAVGLNTHIAQATSKEITAFARAHGAHTIVFEKLKGWRPKGGRKKSDLKAKFHGWLHAALAKQVEQPRRKWDRRGLCASARHQRLGLRRLREGRAVQGELRALPLQDGQGI